MTTVTANENALLTSGFGIPNVIRALRTLDRKLRGSEQVVTSSAGLADLDDRLLRDIGLERTQIATHSNVFNVYTYNCNLR